MPIGRDKVEKTIGAADEFTDAISVNKGERFTVSVDGTFVATVTYQRRTNGVDWRSAESWTEPVERDGIAAESMEMRLGIPAGQYTSGSAICRIGK